MPAKTVHAAWYEGTSAQAIHRSLHRRGVADWVFTLGTLRYPSHEENRSISPYRPAASRTVCTTSSGSTGLARW